MEPENVSGPAAVALSENVSEKTSPPGAPPPAAGDKPAVDDTWPKTWKNGNATCRIYRVQAKSGYVFYQIADHTSGKRKLRSFSKLAEAEAEADRLTRLLNAGEAHASVISNRDAASFGRAIQLIAPTGDAIELVASRYAEACRILGSGARLLDAAREYAKRHPAELPTKTVAEVVAELLKTKRGRGASERYLQDLQSRLDRFGVSFKNTLPHIGPADVQAWLDNLKRAPQTYVNYRRVLHTFFEFARARGYVIENPVAATETPKVKNSDAVEIFTPEELKKLLDAAVPEFAPCIALQAFAGLRSAETERLEWADIDLKAGHIVVAGEKAKTASRRIVPITPNLKTWLARCANRGGAVWKGDHYAFYDAQQRAAKIAGVAWKANGLRHSFISYRLAAVQSAAQVALEAGNSPQVVFAHYRELVRPADAKRWFNIKPQ